jgi:hypothetical protein
MRAFVPLLSLVAATFGLASSAAAAGSVRFPPSCAGSSRTWSRPTPSSSRPTCGGPWPWKCLDAELGQLLFRVAAPRPMPRRSGACKRVQRPRIGKRDPRGAGIGDAGRVR